MRFRVETIFETDKTTGALNVRVRMIGRVPRAFGGFAAGVRFAITETVRNYIEKAGGKADGETVS